MKFLRRLAVGLIALAFASGAHAADMAVKVPPPVAAPVLNFFTPSPCSTTLCNEWFVTLGLGGVGSNLDILGSGIDNSIFNQGGLPFAGVGGQLWNGSTFLGFEADAGYTIGTPSTVNGASANLSGGLAWQLFEAGGNLGALFGSPEPVAVNNALAADLISLYIATGPVEAFGNSSLGTKSVWATGAGARYLLPTATRVPLMLDIKYLYGNNQNTAGVAANKSLQLVMFGVDAAF
jgi:opacity protein-like surface antigen